MKTYILDEKRKLCFELGPAWATGFDEEALTHRIAVLIELSHRIPFRPVEHREALADAIERFVKSADHNVSLYTSERFPEGFSLYGSFQEVFSLV